jgi:hypothetical protein
MRTTLDLEHGPLREAKKAAARRGTTLTRILEQSLRACLTGRSRGRSGYRYRPVIVRGHGPPAVNIDDRKALDDRLDGLA